MRTGGSIRARRRSSSRSKDREIMILTRQGAVRFYQGDDRDFDTVTALEADAFARGVLPTRQAVYADPVDQDEYELDVEESFNLIMEQSG